MKKLLGLFLALLLMSTCVYAEPLDSTVAFVNIQMDENDKVLGNYGLGIPLSDKFMAFNYVTAGEYNSSSIEFGYFLKKSKLSVILLAGPNVDWTDKVNDPVAYLVGAAGVITSYNIASDYGIHAWGKYHFAFEDDVAYQNGYLFGAGLFIFM